MSEQKSDNNGLNIHRSKYLTKLLPHLRKSGLANTSMDEMSKTIGISRATLYKYFKSKEDVFTYLIDRFSLYIEDENLIPLENDESFATCFELMFEKSAVIKIYFSDVFIKDIENSYPHLYEKLHISLKKREDNLSIFIKKGIERGIYNDINPKLFLLQDELLKTLFTAKYLLENQISLDILLKDYFELKKIQLFKSDKLSLINEESSQKRISIIVDSVNKNILETV